MTGPGAAAGSRPAPLLGRADAPALVALVVGVLAFHAGASWLGAARAGIPLSHLGVYYDGFLYLEIAKSFPLPFGPGALDYAGQAPGYPALLWGLRQLSLGLGNWGGVALAGAWLSAAGAAVAFYALAKALGGRPLLAAVAFVAVNPRWAAVAAAAHPEPLAGALVTAALAAFVRGRVAWTMVWLTIATLTRFPALLVALPVAGAVLWERHRAGQPWVRVLPLLGLPAIALALWHGYLTWRVPEFAGIFAAHQVFWQTGFGWPFASIYQSVRAGAWGRELPLRELTLASLAVYAVAVGLGLRERDRRLWVLPGIVAVLVLFHASLRGILGAWDFTRLVILAWPAAAAILWRAGGMRLPQTLLVGGALVLGGASFWFSARLIEQAVAYQQGARPLFEYAIERIDRDRPSWLDFRGLTRQRTLEHRSLKQRLR